MNLRDLPHFEKLTSDFIEHLNSDIHKTIKGGYNFRIAPPTKKAYGALVNTLLKNFKENISTIDEAFLNSVLSFSTYERNSWMIRSLKYEFSNITPIVQQAMKTTEGMYGLKVWHFMKNTFETIPDHKLKIPREQIITNSYGYKTEFSYFNGEYSAANGLAHATVLTSKNPNGDGSILHLSFRGTEFSRLNDYLLGPYLDMTAYYQHFKPLTEYLKAYISNPENKITELHVNGHSLGGAMVQQFLRHNSAEDYPVPIKGFTFGSPGSEKKWYHKFMTVAYHAIGRRVSVPSEPELKENDPRITEFYHGNDPVPIVGLLGYRKSGNTRKLTDTAYMESKAANLEKKTTLEKLPAFGKMITFFKEQLLNKFNTKFHDSARYIMNLRNHIEEHYEKHPHLAGTINSNTKHWQNWIKQENYFGSLSIRYRNAFEYLVKMTEPELDKDQVNEKVLQLRERMKFDSHADAILAKTRKGSESYTKFLQPDVKVEDDLSSLVSLNYKGREIGDAVKKMYLIRQVEAKQNESKETKASLT